MNYLFVTGCGRTGTTAMAELLNFDNRIMVSIEAYKGMDVEVMAADFKDEKAFDDKFDNSYKPLSEKQGLIKSNKEKRSLCKTEFIGNKEPAYVFSLSTIGYGFPGCKIIIMYRDLYAVASSFNVRAARPKDNWPKENDYRFAVERWNLALEGSKSFIEGGHLNDVFIVHYEKLFSGKIDHIEALYRFLGLDITDSVLAGFEYVTRDWPEREAKPLELDDDMRSYLDENKDRYLEQWTLTRIDEQLVRYNS